MKTYIVYSNQDDSEPIMLDEQSIETFFAIENIDFYTIIEVI